MTIAVPGLEPVREQPSAPRPGAGDHPETGAAFVAALMALLPPPVVPQGAAAAPGDGAPGTGVPAVPAAAPEGVAPLPSAAAPAEATVPTTSPATTALTGARAALTAVPAVVVLPVPPAAAARTPVAVAEGRPTPRPTLPVSDVRGAQLADAGAGAQAAQPAGVPVPAVPGADVAVAPGPAAEVPATHAPAGDADPAVVPPAMVPLPVVAAGPVVGAAPAPPPAVPAAHVQVLHAVSPLLHAPDGSYSLELQLHPRELGLVHVTVEMRHGELSIHLHAADAGAGDLLRDSLPDLREQLEAQGLRTAGLDVGSGSQGGRPAPEPRDLAPPASGRVHADDPGAAPVPAPAGAAGSSGLDIRL